MNKPQFWKNWGLSSVWIDEVIHQFFYFIFSSFENGLVAGGIISVEKISRVFIERRLNVSHRSSSFFYY